MSDLRERVLEFVGRYPGVHAREIERQLRLVSRLAGYHLDALEDAGLVRKVEERGFSRYLRAELKMPPKDLALLCKLRRTPVLQIVLFLLQRKQATPTQIAKEIQLAKPSTSYHLRELLEDGTILVRAHGRERWCRLTDEGRVRRVLDAFEPLPGELDSFASVWEDLTR